MTTAISNTKAKKAARIGYDLHGALRQAAEIGKAARDTTDRLELLAAVTAIAVPPRGHGLGDLTALFMNEAEAAARYDAAGEFTVYGQARHDEVERARAFERAKDREWEEWVLRGLERQQAIARDALVAVGFEHEHTSGSGSVYFARMIGNRRVRVRVSDHYLPQTDERRYNHEQGWRCAELEIVLRPRSDAVAEVADLLAGLDEDEE